MESGESVLRKRRHTPASTDSDETKDNNPVKATTDADKIRTASLPPLSQKYSQPLPKQLKVVQPVGALCSAPNKASVGLNKLGKTLTLQHYIQTRSLSTVSSGRAVACRSCFHTSKEGTTPIHHRSQLDKLQLMSTCECGGGDDRKLSPKMAELFQKDAKGSSAFVPERLKHEKVDSSDSADKGGVTKCCELAEQRNDEILSKTSKSTASKKETGDQPKSTRVYYLYLILLTVAALYMRLFNIEVPDHIW